MNCLMSGTFFAKLLPLRITNIVSLGQMMKKSNRKALINTFFAFDNRTPPFAEIMQNISLIQNT